MKKLLLTAAFLCTISSSFAQEGGYFFGGFESNSQWLLDDDGINFVAPEDNFRSNNYFQLNYSLGKFTAGIQYEAYLPDALLGYSPVYENGNGVGTYYLNYKAEKLDVTGGYFYDQFGSGLAFRSWEDRQLGINNSIRGARVKYNITNYADFTALYGQQRIGFEVSEGTLQGLDANIDLSTALGIEAVDLRFGASYVNRYQDQGVQTFLPSNVSIAGARLDFVVGPVYGGVEVNTKSKDALFFEGNLVSEKLYDGTAMQVNLGYSQKGLGINGTFRRLENFNFYADREAAGNQFNDQVVNFLPALSKTQDYLLTNIYVYNAQPGLVIEQAEQRAGEVATQFDVYYTINKGSALGGKYGTKIAANFSYAGALDAEYNIDNRFYEAKFIGSGSRYYRDFNFEIKKKWTPTFSSVATYQNVYIDKAISQGGFVGTQGEIKAQIAVLEGTYKLKNTQSIRAEAQHLWSEQDRQNWMAAVVEYNFSSRFAMYVYDNWNYRELSYDGEESQIHYYSVGGSYTEGRTRLSMNYGRQRGGLICVGGVCRVVPESNGLSASLNISF
ncbi:MAG: DUF6029 family protein [Patiriisocius sp.]|uniref:DUF6029 family protein n=1 Tax=Patiriisocius sp. TaxID=2822396 RepID=UPI003EF5032E